MIKYETIIVGGGISGLSCARRLHDEGKNFLLITKDLGGRMLSSKSFEVDYGAAYITEDYTNVLKYVDKGERMRVRDFFFFDGDNYSNMFILKNIKFIPKIIKLLLILKKFRKHLLKYRKQAPYKSIEKCFKDDLVLLKYWKMPAKDFINKHGFKELNERYCNPVATATTFIESDKINTCYYLGVLLPMISKAWVINYKHTRKRLTKGYEDKIKIGSVIKVQKNKDGTFSIHSSVGDFITKNVVLAAPEKVLEKVYDVPKPFIQQGVYIFHIVGRQKDIYQNKKVVIFRSKHHDVFMIWGQKNTGDVISSMHANPDFRQYYETYHVVKRTHWNPGIIIPKDRFIKQKLDKNLYLASDYNFSSLEDSFLTGLYAANQIINPIS